jgi:hypothetical protein
VVDQTTVVTFLPPLTLDLSYTRDRE